MTDEEFKKNFYLMAVKFMQDLLNQNQEEKEDSDDEFCSSVFPQV